MANRIWTHEEDEIIRADRAKRVPVPVIAAKLNRPVPATYLRAAKLGTKIQEKHPWTENDAQKLERLVRGAHPPTDRELAAAFGRTIASVRWKISLLELTHVRPALGRPADRREAKDCAGRKPPASRPARSPQTACSPAPQSGRDELRSDKGKRKAEQALNAQARKIERSFAAQVAKLARDDAASLNRAKREQEKLLTQLNRRLRIEAARAHALQRKEEMRLNHQESVRQATEARAEARRIKSEEQKKTAQIQAMSRKLHRPTSLEALPVNIGIVQEAPLVPVVTFNPDKCNLVVKDDTPEYTSGRGGWKTRRTAKIRPINGDRMTRADALVLADAAQAAIEAYIKAKGVTRPSSNDEATIISRLRALGYIITQAPKGWLIDHRHHISTAKALRAFAEQRGLAPVAA